MGATVEGLGAREPCPWHHPRPGAVAGVLGQLRSLRRPLLFYPAPPSQLTVPSPPPLEGRQEHRGDGPQPHPPPQDACRTGGHMAIKGSPSSPLAPMCIMPLGCVCPMRVRLPPLSPPDVP